MQPAELLTCSHDKSFHTGLLSSAPSLRVKTLNGVLLWKPDRTRSYTFQDLEAQSAQRRFFKELFCVPEQRAETFWTGSQLWHRRSGHTLVYFYQCAEKREREREGVDKERAGVWVCGCESWMCWKLKVTSGRESRSYRQCWAAERNLSSQQKTFFNSTSYTRPPKIPVFKYMTYIYSCLISKENHISDTLNCDTYRLYIHLSTCKSLIHNMTFYLLIDLQCLIFKKDKSTDSTHQSLLRACVIDSRGKLCDMCD